MTLKRTFDFKGRSSAGVWNFHIRGETWRLYREPQGWRGWPLHRDERPFQGQHFARRKDLVQAIRLWMDLNAESPEHS